MFLQPDNLTCIIQPTTKSTKDIQNLSVGYLSKHVTLAPVTVEKLSTAKFNNIYSSYSQKFFVTMLFDQETLQ